MAVSPLIRSANANALAGGALFEQLFYSFVDIPEAGLEFSFPSVHRSACIWFQPSRTRVTQRTVVQGIRVAFTAVSIDVGFLCTSDDLLDLRSGVSCRVEIFSVYRGSELVQVGLYGLAPAG